MDKRKTTFFGNEDVVGWKYEVWTLKLRRTLPAGSSSNLEKFLISAVHKR